MIPSEDFITALADSRIISLDFFSETVAPKENVHQNLLYQLSSSDNKHFSIARLTMAVEVMQKDEQLKHRAVNAIPE